MQVMQTARTRIREFQLSDIPGLARILGDPSVMEFSSKGPLTEEDTLQFIAWCIDSYRQHGHGPWALTEKQSGALIGFCGLSLENVDGVEEIEIGYRLAKDQWGKGLATEAATRVIEYGFSDLNINSIIGIVSPRHTASLRVLAKLGFHSFYETRFSGWDVRIYRQNRQDWQVATH